MNALDCRLAAIEGFEAHRSHCDRVFERLPPSQGRRAILLSIPDTSLFYCQYDFKFDRGDAHSLKMLQDMSYLRVAWEHLARSHDLRAVYVVDDQVRIVGDTRGFEKIAFTSIRTIELGLTPLLVRPPPPPQRGGLFGWLKGLVGQKDDDWLTQLERLIKRFVDHDEVDDDVLPDTLLELRVRLLSECVKAIAHGKDDHAERLKAIYLGLARFKPPSAGSAFYQARMQMHANESQTDATIRHARAWMDLSVAADDVELMYRMALPAFLTLTGMDAKVARAVVSEEERNVGWRVRSIDPCYLTRACIAKSGILTDRLLNGTTDRHLYWRLQRGIWRAYERDWANAAADLRMIGKSTNDVRFQLLAQLTLADVRLGQGGFVETLALCRNVESMIPTSGAPLHRRTRWVLTAGLLKLKAVGDDSEVQREVHANAVRWARAFLYDENPSECAEMVAGLGASPVSTRLAQILLALAEREERRGDGDEQRSLLELAVSLLRCSVGFVCEEEVVITSYAAYALFIHAAWTLAMSGSDLPGLFEDALDRMNELAESEGYRELRGYAELYPSMPESPLIELVSGIARDLIPAARP